MCSLIRNYFSLNRLKKQWNNRKVSLLMFYDRKSVVSDKSRIQRFVILRRAVIGDYTYIGYNTNIYHAEIGKFCSISKDVSIGLPSHPLTYFSSSPIFVNIHNGTGYSWSKENLFSAVPDKVVVGNDVWIGMKSTIMGGVKIGNGAVIAAHSVVTKDVPPYAIVGGVPAKVIKYRFSAPIIEALEKSKWWEYSDEHLKKNIRSFQEEVTDENYLELLQKLERL